MREKKFKLLVESQLEKAELIFAIQSITDEMQDIAEKISKMKVETISPLVDRMKAEFGIKDSTRFNEVVGEQLQSALDALLSAKDKISNEQLRLSGDADDIEDFGSDEMDDFDMDTPPEFEREKEKPEIKEEPRKIKVESKQSKLFKLDKLLENISKLPRKEVDKILESINYKKLPKSIQHKINEARKGKCARKKSKLNENVTLTKNDYELHLNSITDKRKIEKEFPEVGKKYDVKAFGTFLRKNYPIAFDEGFQEWTMKDLEKVDESIIVNERQKDLFTGKIINVPNFDDKVAIGKKSGITASGVPTYDIHRLDPINKRMGKKIGELNVNFIKKYMKLNESKKDTSSLLLIESMQGHKLKKKFKDINSMKLWINENKRKIKTVKVL